MMACDSGDRVLKLTPMWQIRAWADGALDWQVIALVERLRAVAVRPGHGGRSGPRRETG